MNAGSRIRKPGRSTPFRDPKPIILVVCEGEITEKQYLDGITKASRNSRVTIQIAPESGLDPKALVEAAKKHKKQADENPKYDQIWCVFDVDDHKRIADAKQMAKDNGLLLAVSNPCFELWLLLHFEDTGTLPRDKLKMLLRKKIAKYDKHIRFNDFESGVEPAIRRAKALDKLAKDSGEPDRNPSTGVYHLVEAIQRD